MDKQAVIEFIKKNLLSLLCALVAILAVVATIYPIGGLIQDLQTAANSRQNYYPQLAGYTRVQRKLPLTDPTKSLADAPDLTIFPNQATIDAVSKVQDKLIAQAKDALAYVNNLSSDDHTLLVPTVLPDSQSPTTGLYFAQVYSKVLSTDLNITAVGDPTAKPPIAPDKDLVNFKAQNLVNDILHGTLKLSQKQIDDAKSDLWQHVYAPRLYYRNGERQAVNEPEIRAEFTVAAAQIPRELRAKLAKTKKIYVDTTTFELNPMISQNQVPDAVNIWYAQTALWIQQDIAKAIAGANGNSTNILDAQVKHLIALQIDAPPMYTFAPPPAADSAMGAAPAGPTGPGPSSATANQPLPVAYSVSPTGRASNAMYDVIHFKLLMDVDARHVNDVIEALSKGRLITIYKQGLYAVDPAVEAADGYLYGDGRVVRLQLQGEIDLMRSWTMPWMPDRIKQSLLQMQAPGMPPGGMPAGGNPAMPNPNVYNPSGFGGTPPPNFQRPR